MKDLIEFLRSIVVTPALLDTKYFKSVPDLIAEMKALVESSDNGGAKKKRKRRPKTTRIGKTGLYRAEDEYVRTWWKANKPDLHDDEVAVRPEEESYHISCLRTRETQLQIILILEVLALESMRPAENEAESQLPGLAPSPLEAGAAKAAKKRKTQDFSVLLDILADRLCIWQSTTPDEVKALAESQRKGTDVDRSDKASPDPLKDFCVDIIIPL